MALAGLEGRHEGRRQQNGTREPFGHAGVPPSLTSLAMNFSRSLASLAFAASAFCAAFASAAFCSSGVSTFSSAMVRASGLWSSRGITRPLGGGCH